MQGCRLPSGGGVVLPGAMPFLHRWWGNPMFSLLARRWFNVPIHDVYCGLRGFTKALYERLQMRCTGMEFATEMIIRASVLQARIAEAPITLHPDGRTSHAPHLKTFRDGWRTLRFFLIMSPRWLFLYPGFFLTFAGLIAYAIAMPGLAFNGVTFDAHTLVFATLAVMCGWPAVLFHVLTRVFSIADGLLPESEGMRWFFRLANLERGLVASGLAMIAGLALLLAAVFQWRQSGFGNLDYASTMRIVVPGAGITAVAFQTILASFFMSILSMRRSS